MCNPKPAAAHWAKVNFVSASKTVANKEMIFPLSLEMRGLLVKGQ